MATTSVERRLAGATALVTGASSGVGLEIARALAAGGARVLMPVRDRAKGERAASGIRSGIPDADLVVHHVDLARFATVTALTERLSGEETAIDLFVMNAGIVLLGDRERHVTEDGNELHLQTNFLGHAALTFGLLPLLRAGRARVAVQCSLAAAVYRFDERDLQSRRRYRPLRAYGRSKTALGLFGRELGRRSDAESWGVSVNLCHPGVSPGTGIAPDVRARMKGGIVNRVVDRLGNTPAQAAESALAALGRDAGTGRFFAPSGAFGFSGLPRARRLFRPLRDAAAAQRAWAVAAELERSGGR